MTTRRSFLRVLGVGLLIPALPEISTLNSTLLDFFTSPGDEVAEIDTTLERLLERARSSSSPFVANAETYVTEVSPQQLLNSPSALLNILDNLELRKSFSPRVNYEEAAQCRSNFQATEAMWRGQFGSFTDIQRAPADKNIAYMMAGNISPSNNLTDAQGASQFGGKRAIAISGDDPSVMIAASSLLNQNYSPVRRERAQSLALTDKRTLTMDDGQVAMRYETPVNSFVRLPRVRRSSMGRRSRGAVIAHNKVDRRNPNNLYYAELYV